MSNELDGSFSGLWICELCGKTGTDCTCEHFARNGTWGKRRELTDAEAAAEYWRQVVEAGNAFDRAYPYGDGPEVDRENERLDTMERFATLPGAWRMNYDGRGYLADFKEKEKD